MLYRTTAIDSGGRMGSVGPVNIPVDATDLRRRVAAEYAIDDVLADSFPASDPPSWTMGVSRPGPVASMRLKRASYTPPIEDFRHRGARAPIALSAESPDRARLASVARAVGIVLLLPFVGPSIVLSLALAVRGVVEVVGWLFGATVR